jgi:hypothetical protein
VGVGVRADLGEGEEGPGGAVAGLGVGVGKLFLERVERTVEEVAEAVGGGVELFGAFFAEGSGEGAVVVAPTVEGFSIDVDVAATSVNDWPARRRARAISWGSVRASGRSSAS